MLNSGFSSFSLWSIQSKFSTVRILNWQSDIFSKLTIWLFSSKLTIWLFIMNISPDHICDSVTYKCLRNALGDDCRNLFWSKYYFCSEKGWIFSWGRKGGFGHIFPVLCKSDSCLDKIYAPAFLGWTLTSLPWALTLTSASGGSEETWNTMVMALEGKLWFRCVQGERLKWKNEQIEEIVDNKGHSRETSTYVAAGSGRNTEHAGKLIRTQCYVKRLQHRENHCYISCFHLDQSY